MTVDDYSFITTGTLHENVLRDSSEIITLSLTDTNNNLITKDDSGRYDILLNDELLDTSSSLLFQAPNNCYGIESDVNSNVELCIQYDKLFSTKQTFSSYNYFYDGKDSWAYSFAKTKDNVYVKSGIYYNGDTTFYAFIAIGDDWHYAGLSTDDYDLLDVYSNFTSTLDYETGDIHLYLNGVEVLSDSTSATPIYNIDKVGIYSLNTKIYGGRFFNKIITDFDNIFPLNHYCLASIIRPNNKIFSYTVKISSIVDTLDIVLYEPTTFDCKYTQDVLIPTTITVNSPDVTAYKRSMYSDDPFDDGSLKLLIDFKNYDDYSETLYDRTNTYYINARNNYTFTDGLLDANKLILDDNSDTDHDNEILPNDLVVCDDSSQSLTLSIWQNVESSSYFSTGFSFTLNGNYCRFEGGGDGNGGGTFSVSLDNENGDVVVQEDGTLDFDANELTLYSFIIDIDAGEVRVYINGNNLYATYEFDDTVLAPDLSKISDWKILNPYYGVAHQGIRLFNRVLSYTDLDYLYTNEYSGLSVTVEVDSNFINVLPNTTAFSYIYADSLLITTFVYLIDGTHAICDVDVLSMTSYVYFVADTPAICVVDASSLTITQPIQKVITFPLYINTQFIKITVTTPDVLNELNLVKANSLYSYCKINTPDLVIDNNIVIVKTSLYIDVFCNCGYDGCTQTIIKTDVNVLNITIDDITSSVTVNVDSISLTCSLYYMMYISSSILPIIFITPNFVGGYGESSIVDAIRPQSLFLNITTLYLQNNRNSYISISNSLVIMCDILEVKLSDICYVNTIYISININHSIANPIKNRRVVKIGSVDLPIGLYWSKNYFSREFIQTNSLTVNGDSVVSIQRLKKYGQKYSIHTDSDFSLNKEIVDKLILEINDESYDILFDDGLIINVKNNLLEKPFTLEPIFNGSDEYYITLEILV